MAFRFLLQQVWQHGFAAVLQVQVRKRGPDHGVPAGAAVVWSGTVGAPTIHGEESAALALPLRSRGRRGRAAAVCYSV